MLHLTTTVLLSSNIDCIALYDTNVWYSPHKWVTPCIRLEKLENHLFGTIWVFDFIQANFTMYHFGEMDKYKIVVQMLVS